MTDDDVVDGDVESALESVLEEADAVYHEYDQGYLDADAALERLRPRIEDLRSVHDETP